MASIISAGTTSTTALSYTGDTSGVLQLQTNGTTTAVTIDTSQRVGIGTASPSYLLQVTKSSNGDVISWNATSGKQGYLYADTNAVSIGDTSSVNGQNILFNTTNTYVATYTNGTEKMRVDGSGNLGLGVTPSAWGSTYNKYTTQIGTYASLGTNTYGTGSTILAHNYYSSASSTLYLNTGGYASNYAQSGGGHSWSVCSTSGTAGGSVSLTTAMTLTNGGYLGIGSGATSPGFPLTVSLAQQNLVELQNTNAGSKFWYEAVSSANTYYFVNGSSVGVTIADGGNSWSSYSDSRLKNVTGTYANPLSDIAQLQPVKFTWKSDTTNKPCVGVIAQSVQIVVPEAIDQAKLVNADELNDQTEYLSVRYTELIPLMIASIQALTAKVTALEAKVGA